MATDGQQLITGCITCTPLLTLRGAKAICLIHITANLEENIICVMYYQRLTEPVQLSKCQKTSYT